MSYVIRKMQIKIRGYHYTEWSKSETLTTPNAVEDVEQQKLLFIVGRNVKSHSYFGRQFGSFVIKLNIFLPYDPGNEFLGVYPKHLKTMSTQKPANRCF